MTVKQIRAFLAVAQSLSFAVACERLHLSQSALSLTIKALEEGLGGRLFTRNTRNVALTPEGESLVPLARRLIADWDRCSRSQATAKLRLWATARKARICLRVMVVMLPAASDWFQAARQLLSFTNQSNSKINLTNI